MTKQRREKNPINEVRDEKRDITINTKEIHRIISEYFQILYSSKLKNLNKMDKFQDAYNQKQN
jgi:hypothetical protein